jgi:hypothetical protein
MAFFCPKLVLYWQPMRGSEKPRDSGRVDADGRSGHHVGMREKLVGLARYRVADRVLVSVWVRVWVRVWARVLSRVGEGVWDRVWEGTL